jgi:hypothetical protein
VRNFLLINNFANRFLVLQFLTFFSFFLGTDFNVISLTSLPMNVREVRENSVPKKKKNIHNRVRTPATYILICLWQQNSLKDRIILARTRAY